MPSQRSLLNSLSTKRQRTVDIVYHALQSGGFSLADLGLDDQSNLPVREIIYTLYGFEIGLADDKTIDNYRLSPGEWHAVQDVLDRMKDKSSAQTQDAVKKTNEKITVMRNSVVPSEYEYDEYLDFASRTVCCVVIGALHAVNAEKYFAQQALLALLTGAIMIYLPRGHLRMIEHYSLVFGCLLLSMGVRQAALLESDKKVYLAFSSLNEIWFIYTSFCLPERSGLFIYVLSNFSVESMLHCPLREKALDAVLTVLFLPALIKKFAPNVHLSDWMTTVFCIFSGVFLLRSILYYYSSDVFSLRSLSLSCISDSALAVSMAGDKTGGDFICSCMLCFTVIFEIYLSLINFIISYNFSVAGQGRGVGYFFSVYLKLRELVATAEEIDFIVKEITNRSEIGMQVFECLQFSCQQSMVDLTSLLQGIYLRRDGFSYFPLYSYRPASGVLVYSVYEASKQGAFHSLTRGFLSSLNKGLVEWPIVNIMVVVIRSALNEKEKKDIDRGSSYFQILKLVYPLVFDYVVNAFTKGDRFIFSQANIRFVQTEPCYTIALHESQLNLKCSGIKPKLDKLDERFGVDSSSRSLPCDDRYKSLVDMNAYLEKVNHNAQGEVIQWLFFKHKRFIFFVINAPEQEGCDDVSSMRHKILRTIKLLGPLHALVFVDCAPVLFSVLLAAVFRELCPEDGKVVAEPLKSGNRKNSKSYLYRIMLEFCSALNIWAIHRPDRFACFAVQQKEDFLFIFFELYRNGFYEPLKHFMPMFECNDEGVRMDQLFADYIKKSTRFLGVAAKLLVDVQSGGAQDKFLSKLFSAIAAKLDSIESHSLADDVNVTLFRQKYQAYLAEKEVPEPDSPEIKRSASPELCNEHGEGGEDNESVIILLLAQFSEICIGLKAVASSSKINKRKVTNLKDNISGIKQGSLELLTKEDRDNSHNIKEFKITFNAIKDIMNKPDSTKLPADLGRKVSKMITNVNRVLRSEFKRERRDTLSESKAQDILSEPKTQLTVEKPTSAKDVAASLDVSAPYKQKKDNDPASKKDDGGGVLGDAANAPGENAAHQATAKEATPEGDVAVGEATARVLPADSAVATASVPTPDPAAGGGLFVVRNSVFSIATRKDSNIHFSVAIKKSGEVKKIDDIFLRRDLQQLPCYLENNYITMIYLHCVLYKLIQSDSVREFSVLNGEQSNEFDDGFELRGLIFNALKHDELLYTAGSDDADCQALSEPVANRCDQLRSIIDSLSGNDSDNAEKVIHTLSYNKDGNRQQNQIQDLSPDSRRHTACRLMELFHPSVPNNSCHRQAKLFAMYLLKKMSHKHFDPADGFTDHRLNLKLTQDDSLSCLLDNIYKNKNIEQAANAIFAHNDISEHAEKSDVDEAIALAWSAMEKLSADYFDAITESEEGAISLRNSI